MYKYLLYSITFFIAIMFFQCTTKRKKNSDINEKGNTKEISLFDNTKIKEIHIYCWCFSLFPYKYIQGEEGVLIKDFNNNIVDDIFICNTPIGMSKERMIVKDNVLKSLNSPKVINTFQDSLLSNFISVEDHKIGSDSRLVFVLEHEDEQKSYLTYFSERKMLFNDSFLIEYPYRVDSVLYNIDDVVFICPDS